MRMPLLLSCDGLPDVGLALASGADALVLDLGPPGDGTARDARRAAARDALLRLAAVAPRLRGVVRLGPLAAGDVDADLDAVMPGTPGAVLLRGAVGASDIQRLAAKLAVREAEAGLAAGTTGILAAAADTARGVLALPAVPGASPRLRALVWDGEALAAALGVDAAAEPCRQGRGLLRLAAAACGRAGARHGAAAGRRQRPGGALPGLGARRFRRHAGRPPRRCRGDRPPDPAAGRLTGPATGAPCAGARVDECRPRL